MKKKKKRNCRFWFTDGSLVQGIYAFWSFVSKIEQKNKFKINHNNNNKKEREIKKKKLNMSN